MWNCNSYVIPICKRFLEDFLSLNCGLSHLDERRQTPHQLDQAHFSQAGICIQAGIGIALAGPCGTIVHDMFIGTNILGARQ